MSNYIDGKMPEPDRLTRIVSKEREVVKDQSSLADDSINAIANAVIKAIEFKKNTNSDYGIKDDFEDESSMQKMAEAMIVQRGSESNFKNLGRIKETQKDTKDIDKTIDILSNIDEGD